MSLQQNITPTIKVNKSQTLYCLQVVHRNLSSLPHPNFHCEDNEMLVDARKHESANLTHRGVQIKYTRAC